MNTMQLDLFAAPPMPPVAPVVEESDPLVDRLIESGLVSNRFLLGLNQAFGILAMDLPSRLFKWPVQFADREHRPDGKSALLLNHPDLDGMPFLDEIEARSGVRPHWEPADEFGRDRSEKWRYFHALDLLTDEHWLDLLRTRNFTDRGCIVSGLKFRAEYGGLSIANMRSVLAEISEPEPGDQSAAYLASDQVRVTNAESGKFVGFGFDRGNAASVWAAVHGLEAKKFRRDKSGFLRFAPAFLAEKTAA